VQAVNKFQSEICGPLHGGDSGRRLIEPNDQKIPAYYTEVPAHAPIAENRCWLVALYHVFGSEELSLLSPGIAERTPDPYLALNPEDAAAFGIVAGDRVTAAMDGMDLDLPVRIMEGCPRTVAGVPVGIPGMPAVGLPAAASLRKA